MPTYKNVTTQRQNINGKVIEPGHKVFSTSYFDENSVKLLMIDESPYYNPIILSDVIVSKGAINIPKTDNLGERVVKYAIHFFVEKGRITVWYNSKNNNPPLYLYETAKWNVRCYDRTIDKIIIDANESFLLNIIIEKI